jgi:hypothetical protein
MNRLFSLLVILSLASVVSAGEIFIPASYRGEGAGGSLWRTEIVVTNLSKFPVIEPVLATITLHVPGVTPMSVPMLLSTNEVVAVPDALFNWFGVISGGGIVRISWVDANARIAARARIYNVASEGEYGQGVPSFRVEELESEVFLPGLSGVNGNRTNVGITNPHPFDILAWVELIDTSGAGRGMFAVSVPARSFKQLNDIFAHFQAGPMPASMVRVTSSNATIYAWASIVRDDTGDATFVTPVR